MSGVADTPESVQRYAQCTLLSASLDNEESDSIQQCIDFLLDSEFIMFKSDAEQSIPAYFFIMFICFHST